MQCVQGSPSTFKPGSKPWINLNNAEIPQIISFLYNSKCR
ncbi:(4Fe-4S)-binding protein [Butyrivibrio fibrisolvens]